MSHLIVTFIHLMNRNRNLNHFLSHRMSSMSYQTFYSLSEQPIKCLNPNQTNLLLHSPRHLKSRSETLSVQGILNKFLCANLHWFFSNCLYKNLEFEKCFLAHFIVLFKQENFKYHSYVLLNILRIYMRMVAHVKHKLTHLQLYLSFFPFIQIGQL